MQTSDRPHSKISDAPLSSPEVNVAGPERYHSAGNPEMIRIELSPQTIISDSQP
jgi:hypothetical protein